MYWSRICLVLLIANLARAEWVNLWDERDRLQVECGDAPCSELVGVLRKIGLLDDARAAQEAIVSTAPTLANQLLLVRLQVETRHEEQALGSMQGLATNPALNVPQLLELARLARAIGEWGLTATTADRAVAMPMSDAVRLELAVFLAEMDEWGFVARLLKNPWQGLWRAQLAASEIADGASVLYARALAATGQFERFLEQAPTGGAIIALAAKEDSRVAALVDRAFQAAPADADLAAAWLRSGTLNSADRFRQAVATSPEDALRGLYRLGGKLRKDPKGFAGATRLVNLAAAKVAPTSGELLTLWNESPSVEPDARHRLAVLVADIETCGPILREHGQAGELAKARALLRALLTAEALTTWEDFYDDHVRIHDAVREVFVWHLRAGSLAELLGDMERWYAASTGGKRLATGSALWHGQHWSLADPEAEALMADLATKSPSAPALWHARIQDEDRAAEELEQLLKIDPARGDAHRLQLAKSLTDSPKRLADLAAEAQAMSWDPEALLDLAHVMQALDLQNLARDLAKSAARLLEQSPGDENIGYLRRILKDVGENDAAEQICARQEISTVPRRQRLLGRLSSAPNDVRAQLALIPDRLDAGEDPKPSLMQRLPRHAMTMRQRVQWFLKINDMSFSHKMGMLFAGIDQRWENGYMSGSLGELIGYKQAEMKMLAAEGRLDRQAAVEEAEIVDRLCGHVALSDYPEFIDRLIEIRDRVLPADAWTPAWLARVRATFAKKAKDPDETRKQASRRASQRGDHDAAIAIWREWLRADSANANVRDGLVLALEWSGEAMNAQVTAERFARKGAASDALRLGQLHLSRRAYRPAVLAMRSAHLKAPGDSKLAFALTEAYRLSGDKKAAIVTARRALDQPDCADDYRTSLEIALRELLGLPLEDFGFKAGPRMPQYTLFTGPCEQAARSALRDWDMGNRAAARQKAIRCRALLQRYPDADLKSVLADLVQVAPDIALSVADAALAKYPKRPVGELPELGVRNQKLPRDVRVLQPAWGKGLACAWSLPEAYDAMTWSLGRAPIGHWWGLDLIPDLYTACTKGGLWDQATAALSAESAANSRQLSIHALCEKVCRAHGRDEQADSAGVVYNRYSRNAGRKKPTTPEGKSRLIAMRAESAYFAGPIEEPAVARLVVDGLAELRDVFAGDCDFYQLLASAYEGAGRVTEAKAEWAHFGLCQQIGRLKNHPEEWWREREPVESAVDPRWPKGAAILPLKASLPAQRPEHRDMPHEQARLSFTLARKGWYAIRWESDPKRYGDLAIRIDNRIQRKGENMTGYASELVYLQRGSHRIDLSFDGHIQLRKVVLTAE
ncbi:MAG: hypothetical protein ACI8W8_002977 [Rhodothermales bacterium]|jgi:hypothetical protein